MPSTHAVTRALYRGCHNPPQRGWGKLSHFVWVKCFVRFWSFGIFKRKSRLTFGGRESNYPLQKGSASFSWGSLKWLKTCPGFIWGAVVVVVTLPSCTNLVLHHVLFPEKNRHLSNRRFNASTFDFIEFPSCSMRVNAARQLSTSRNHNARTPN